MSTRGQTHGWPHSTRFHEDGNRRSDHGGLAPVPTLRPKARIEWRVKVRATGEGDTRFRVKMTTKRLTSPVEESESTKFYQ